MGISSKVRILVEKPLCQSVSKTENKAIHRSASQTSKENNEIHEHTLIF